MEPVVHRRESTESVIIQRQEEIDELCAQCRAEGRFAFDTEFVMEDRFEPEACLLQVATEQTVALIDPFLDLDLSALWQLVGDAKVETVVHAGQEDLALAVQHTGHVPRNIYDLQIAAGLAGYDYPISLQKLVQATRHIRLHKSKTLTDWRKRPLTDAQLQYAAEDVLYLLGARRHVQDRLERKGRIAWAEAEFQRFEDLTLYRRADEDKLFRVKGTGSLKGPQLAVVRDLLVWRDALAERYNRPARAVLKDHLLVEIARHELTSFDEVRDLRGINLRDTDIRKMAKVVSEALTTSPEKCPDAKPRDIVTAQEAVLTALSTAVVRSYCSEHKLAYGLVATQKSIRELIRHRTISEPADDGAVELLNGWRGKSVGLLLDDVLAGRRTVRVEPSNGTLAVHVVPAPEE